jgi:hypothetical protein
MNFDWFRLIIWVASNQGASASTSWLPVIVGVIGVLGTLSGVVIGGAVSYFIKKTELAHQIKEENRKLRLAKLEELHQRLIELIPIMTAMMTAFIDMKSTRSTSRQQLGDIISPSAVAIAKIQSLLMIYASEFAADFNVLKEKWAMYMTKGTEYLTTPNIASTSLTAYQPEFTKVCLNLQEEVQTKIQKEVLM